MKAFFLIFHTGKHKNRHMNIVESVLRGLKDLRGQTDICWWSKCIWSLFSARGSWALSQSFVPMILQNTGLCKAQAHGMALRTDEEGSLYAECSPKETWSSEQRTEYLLCKWTVLNHRLLQKKEIACRTLNFRSEKGIPSTLVRLTLQETEQICSLEVILILTQCLSPKNLEILKLHCMIKSSWARWQSHNILQNSEQGG